MGYLSEKKGPGAGPLGNSGRRGYKAQVQQGEQGLREREAGKTRAMDRPAAACHLQLALTEVHCARP